MDYQRIYDQIISRAQSENRKKKNGAYYERHHIVPTCLGGVNKRINLVLLTAREHFICHKLLVEIYPNNKRLYRAIWMMANVKLENRDYIVTSREFEQIKNRNSIIMSERMSGVNNPNYGKIGAMTGRVGATHECTPQEREDRSNRMKTNNPNKDRIYIDEEIEIFSERATRRYEKNQVANEGKYIGGKGSHCFSTGRTQTAAANDSRRLKLSGDNGHWTGQKLPIEAINKMKETAKNRPIIMCPHCGLTKKSGGNMTRHHFDNCKFKP